MEEQNLLKDFYKEKIFPLEETFIKEIKDENYEGFLQWSRLTRKSFKAMKEFNDNYAFYAGTVMGVQVTLQRLVPQLNEFNIFEYQMSSYIDRKHYKKLLAYIYSVGKVNNKAITAAVGVESNALAPKLNELVGIKCLSKTKSGKNVYYSLTSNGKKYVKKHLCREIINCEKNVIETNEIVNEKYDRSVTYTVGLSKYNKGLVSYD